MEVTGTGSVPFCRSDRMSDAFVRVCSMIAYEPGEPSPQNPGPSDVSPLEEGAGGLPMTMISM
jgi:hypothetical protein